MKDIYKEPSESSSDHEHRGFWSRVLADQKASGIGMRNFCQQHQLNFSRFAYWKYKKKKIKSANKLVPLQITSDLPAPVKEYPKDKVVIDDEAVGTEIVFKNGHKLILSSTTEETNLLSIIKMVAELQC